MSFCAETLGEHQYEIKSAQRRQTQGKVSLIRRDKGGYAEHDCRC